MYVSPRKSRRPRGPRIGLDEEQLLEFLRQKFGSQTFRAKDVARKMGLGSGSSVRHPIERLVDRQEVIVAHVRAPYDVYQLAPGAKR